MTTAVQKVLIVEDDEHKIDDLTDLLNAHNGKYSLEIKKSVREAIICVKNSDFDVVLLDMSLPNFDQTAAAAGGSGQPQGGLEIIRMLKRIKKNPAIIIVSQYPQMEFDGRFHSLKDSANIIKDKYDVNVVGSVLYLVGSLNWQPLLEDFLRQLR